MRAAKSLVGAAAGTAGKVFGVRADQQAFPGEENSPGVRLRANLFLILSSGRARGTPSARDLSPFRGSQTPSPGLQGKPSGDARGSGQADLVHDGGRRRLDARLLVGEGQLLQQVHVGQGVLQGHVGGHGCGCPVLRCRRGTSGASKGLSASPWGGSFQRRKRVYTH